MRRSTLWSSIRLTLSPLRRRVAEVAVNRLFLGAAFLYVFFSTLDCLSTASALADGAGERNPAAAALNARYGIVSLFVFKVAVVAVILIALAAMPRRPAVWVLTTFAAAIGVVVIANFHAVASLI